MNFSEISHQALHYISKIPPRSYKPILMTLIPAITQIVYKRVRENMYQNAYLSLFGDNLFEVYEEGQPFRTRRDDQHKLFLIIAGTQTVAFFAFALRNRFYFFPAVYTLGHLIWTHKSKSNEHIERVIVQGVSKPVCFRSMDGPKNF